MKNYNYIIPGNEENKKSGFPFLYILTLIFITLKLTGFIAWSWVWVLSPLWIGWAIALLILILFFIIVYCTKGNQLW